MSNIVDNRIKKELYKQNPVAVLTGINKEGICYAADLEDDEIVFFCVPLNDIGDATFFHEMKGKHLIRYIISTNKK